MKCPYCGYIEQKVLDSRPAKDGESIRRRRECLACSRRFTTFEEPEVPRLFVVKRNFTREEFSRAKCLNSLVVACRKRPVTIETLRRATEDIERELYHQFEDEVSTQTIGEMVVKQLRSIDTVAYIRFASVYREFETVEDFTNLIDDVRAENVIEVTLVNN